MLEYMHVKNLALIKDCEIEFEKGLNILTGETGAGKSVLLGSVNLCLGAKADKDIIRTGEEEAYVELVFSANEEAKTILSEMDISCDDDSILISRKITPTKNIFKINGESVPGRQVKELAAALLDIHGQHEHQSLLSNIKQRDMLDAFGGAAIKDALERVGAAYDEYTACEKELSDALAHTEGSAREISLLSYECREIEEAELVIGEDAELEDNYKRMQSAGKLLSLMNESMAMVSSGADQDAGSLVSRAISNLRKAASLDEEASELEEMLVTVEGLLGDFSLAASRYMDKLEFSEEDYMATEERLNTINSLKLKFGNSIEKILEYYEEKSAELRKLEHLEEYIEELKKKTESALCEYRKEAEALSLLRDKASLEFSKLLSGELLSLNFNDSRFKAEVRKESETVSKKGFDTVEFVIATNPGEPMKPIRNVASGGELSRIMLAIKTILAAKDMVDALIFDEIDAGISGRTAWEVAGRLSKLSKEHQVIAITHLAQIAAAADVHFEIEKTVEDNKTTTNIYKLDGEGELKELARLLGGDLINEASLANARELKEKADARKTQC